MAVPAPFSFYSASTHGPVARDGVFDDGTEEGAMVRVAGDERGAVVEDILVVYWPVFDRFLKNMVLVPPVGEGFFVFDGLAAGIGVVFHIYILVLVLYSKLPGEKMNFTITLIIA